jgi:hypothetical protein
MLASIGAVGNAAMPMTAAAVSSERKGARRLAGRAAALAAAARMAKERRRAERRMCENKFCAFFISGKSLSNYNTVIYGNLSECDKYKICEKIRTKKHADLQRYFKCRKKTSVFFVKKTKRAGKGFSPARPVEAAPEKKVCLVR